MANLVFWILTCFQCPFPCRTYSGGNIGFRNYPPTYQILEYATLENRKLKALLLVQYFFIMDNNCVPATPIQVYRHIGLSYLHPNTRIRSTALLTQYFSSIDNYISLVTNWGMHEICFPMTKTDNICFPITQTDVICFPMTKTDIICAQGSDTVSHPRPIHKYLSYHPETNKYLSPTQKIHKQILSCHPDNTQTNICHSTGQNTNKYLFCHPDNTQIIASAPYCLISTSAFVVKYCRLPDCWCWCLCLA